MGDPLMDFDTVIKILFFVVVFGGWIVSTVFKNLIKPAARRPAEGGAPAKGLREFLEEIRKEEAGGGRAAPPAAPVERVEEVVVWEEIEDARGIDEVAEAPARQGERTAFDIRREQWKQETERRRAERARQREERARRRRGGLEPQRAAEEQPERRSVAGRQLDSRLDERDVRSHLDDRRLQSRLADRRVESVASARSAAGRHAHSRELTGALRGLTVKDLILAEVILGKPRSKRRHFRDV